MASNFYTSLKSDLQRLEERLAEYGRDTGWGNNALIQILARIKECIEFSENAMKEAQDGE